MSVTLSLSLLVKLAISISRIKQKTLSYLYRRFLPPDGTKIRFSFTMQRSMRILFLQTYGKYFEVDSSGLKDFVFRYYKVMCKMKQSPISPNKNSPNRKNTIRGVIRSRFKKSRTTIRQVFLLLHHLKKFWNRACFPPRQIQTPSYPTIASTRHWG